MNKNEEVKIKGKITAIRFRNTEGWSVFTIQDEGTQTNCTGVLADISDIGAEITATGQYENSKYGQQLKCSNIIPAPPDVNSDEGVIVLLSKLPGIGVVKARKAVKELGYELAWRVARECPTGLGISNMETAERAIAKAEIMGGSFEALVYLLGLGITSHQASKIITKYGATESIKIVSENPYQLIQSIDGFGFLTVDKIAMKAGIAPNNTARINAALIYCLTASEVNEGNIYLNGKWLIKQCLEMLKDSVMKSNRPLTGLPDYGDVRRCIRGIESEGRIVVDGIKVYSQALLDAEKTIWEAVNVDNS